MKYHNVTFCSGLGLMITDLFKQQPFILCIPAFTQGTIAVVLPILLRVRREKVFIKKLAISKRQWI